MNEETTKHFNRFSPSYSLVAYRVILEYLKKAKPKTLIEIGSGNAASLALIEKSVKCEAFGLDEASSYKSLVPKKYLERVFWTSILNRAQIKKINKKFECAVASRVLHHLIAESPKSSSKLAAAALKNIFLLLADNGKVIILEPIFEPAIFSKLLFYIKKITSRFTRGRIQSIGYWNNLGPPIVNYFSQKELLDLVKEYEIVEQTTVDVKTTFLIRLFFRRKDVCIVVKKRR